MSISKEIGWGPREYLYYEIYRKLIVMNSIAIKWSYGNFGAGCGSYELFGLNLSSSQVDSKLICFASVPLINVTIDLRGNSMRTSESDDAVLILITNGCQIIEDI